MKVEFSDAQNVIDQLRTLKPGAILPKTYLTRQPAVSVEGLISETTMLTVVWEGASGLANANFVQLGTVPNIIGQEEQIRLKIGAQALYSRDQIIRTYVFEGGKVGRIVTRPSGTEDLAPLEDHENDFIGTTLRNIANVAVAARARGLLVVA